MRWIRSPIFRFRLFSRLDEQIIPPAATNNKRTNPDFSEIMFCSLQEQSDDSGEDEAAEDSMCAYLLFVISNYYII